jgi:hypothetical protein
MWRRYIYSSTRKCLASSAAKTQRTRTRACLQRVFTIKKKRLKKKRPHKLRSKDVEDAEGGVDERLQHHVGTDEGVRVAKERHNQRRQRACNICIYQYEVQPVRLAV